MLGVEVGPQQDAVMQEVQEASIIYQVIESVHNMIG